MNKENKLILDEHKNGRFCKVCNKEFSIRRKTNNENKI